MSALLLRLIPFMAKYGEPLILATLVFIAGGWADHHFLMDPAVTKLNAELVAVKVDNAQKLHDVQAALDAKTNQIRADQARITTLTELAAQKQKVQTRTVYQTLKAKVQHAPKVSSPDNCVITDQLRDVWNQANRGDGANALPTAAAKPDAVVQGAARP